MFGLGGWEIAVLGLAALIFFGPHKLPQLMKQAGKIMREVRKASFEFQNSLEREMEDDPYRKAHRREKKRKQKADELGVSPDELKPEAAAQPKPAATPAAVAGAPNGNGAPANGAAAEPPAPAPETPTASPAPDGDKPKTGTA